MGRLRTATVQSHPTAGDQPAISTSLLNFRHHTGRKIAGVFICLGVIGAVSAQSLANESGSSASLTGSQASTSVSAIPEEGTKVNTETSSGGEGMNTSTSVSSSTTNGQTTTKVMVNGQEVPVPSNGSTQKTITSEDGSTTVKIENQQENSGSGASTSTSFTSSTTVSSSLSSGGNP